MSSSLPQPAPNRHPRIDLDEIAASHGWLGDPDYDPDPPVLSAREHERLKRGEPVAFFDTRKLQRVVAGRCQLARLRSARGAYSPLALSGRRESHRTRPGHRRVTAARGSPDDDPGEPEPPRRRLTRYTYAVIAAAVRS